MKIPLIFSAILLIVLACGGSKQLRIEDKAVLKNGERVFKTYCIACHGFDGKLKINGAPDLSKYIGSLKRRIKVITEGKGLMTPFKEILTPEEIEAVAKYSIQLRKRKK